MAPIKNIIDVLSPPLSCLSIGTCLCLTLDGSCSFAQPQLPLKKRKRDLGGNTSSLTMAVDGNTDVCLHLLLGSPSCTPTCCCDEMPIAKKHKRKHQETKKCINVDDEWEIKKVLEPSDISSNLSRLLLNREIANQFVIPVLLGGAEVAQTKGVEVKLWDIQTKSSHSLVFKIWTSAQSHVFTKRWIKEFVLRRKLKKGDKIGLHWDSDNKWFNFSVLHRS